MNCFAISESKIDEEVAMIVYSVDSSFYRQFITNPSIETLNKKNPNITIQTFWILNNNSDKPIKREITKNNNVQIDESKSGIMRIGDLPVYTEFVEFLSSKDNLENVLLKNGVGDSIEYYCLIDNQESKKTPLTIWIKTVSNNYFLIVDESETNYADNPNSTDFLYEFYNHLDFCKKFGLVDGSLVVNGEDITKGNYVKFENNAVYLPFRAVVEKLGYVVDWDEENRWAIFSDKNGIKYILRKNCYPNLVLKNNANDSSYLPPGGNMPFCEIINNRTVIDGELMKNITEILSATIEIDYKNLMVYINNQ